MEELLALVEQEEIQLHYRDLSACPETLLGLYFVNPRTETAHIVLDAKLEHNLPLHRSVLAEELGHHFTAPITPYLVPYTSYSVQLQMNRYESRALRWACNRLIPVDKFCTAVYDGIITATDLAEYFVVTPWLIWRRIGFLHDLDMLNKLKLAHN